MVSRRLAALFLVILTAGACAEAGDDGGVDAAATPDAGSTDVGVEGPCQIEAPAELALAVGALETVTLSGEGWSEVGVRAPAGWRFSLDNHTLALRAPYVTGSAATPLTITATCGVDRTAEAVISLSAAPLEFTQIRPWTPDVDGPLGREYFSMWIDPVDADRLWVFGGFHYVPAQFTPSHDVWSLDLEGETWTRHDDGPLTGLPGGTVARTPDGRMLRYGGLNSGELAGTRDTPFELLSIDTSTSGLVFADAPVEPVQAIGDYQPAFFFHPRTGKFYATCGINDGEGAHSRVRSYDPATHRWEEEVVEGDVPPGRTGQFWAYDEPTDRLIVFSGEGNPQTAACSNCLDDTWALELSAVPLRWTRLAESAGEIGRRNGAYVLDPIAHRLLVWGGTNNGRTTAPGLWALDLTPGEEAWYRVPTLGGAPVRTSGGAVFDAPRRRALFGFGNGDSGVNTDLWALGL